MSGQLEARPPNAPPAATIGLGVQPGTQRAVIASYVIIFGPAGSVSGLFVYQSGTTPGPGNPPVCSIVSTGTTADPYGNAVSPIIEIQGQGRQTIHTAGGIVLKKISGAVAPPAVQVNDQVASAATELTSTGIVFGSGGGFDTSMLRIAAGDVQLTGTHTWLMDQDYTVKAGDTSRATTTLAADPDLTLTGLPANTSYDIEGLLIFEGASGVNFKWDWILGGTDTFTLDAIYNTTGGTFQHSTNIVTVSGAQNHAAQTLGATTPNAIWISGTFQAGNAATSLTLEWAANAAGTAILKKGSKLTACRQS